jgi:molecular chaperone HtpG
MLQDDLIIRRIRKSLIGRVLGALAEMSEKAPDEYETFHEAFGSVLKEGLAQGDENFDKLVNLARFRSSAAGDGPVSFKTYVSRMKEGQKSIYYITADSAAAAAASPHIEAYAAAGCEVLFMTEPVDEWVLMRVKEYDKKPLKAVNRGDAGDLPRPAAEMDGKAAPPKDEAAREFGDLLDCLRAHLQDSVQAVRVSGRLTDSAVCLVAAEDAPDARLERLLRAMHRELPETKRILEVNPGHPLLRAMKARFDKDRKDPKLKEYAELLYGQALITEGSQLKDPLRFTRLVSSLMAEAMRQSASS